MDGRPNLRLCNVILDVQITSFGPKSLYNIFVMLTWGVTVQLNGTDGKWSESDCGVWSHSPDEERNQSAVYSRADV